MVYILLYIYFQLNPNLYVSLIHPLCAFISNLTVFRFHYYYAYAIVYGMQYVKRSIPPAERKRYLTRCIWSNPFSGFVDLQMIIFYRVSTRPNNMTAETISSTSLQSLHIEFSVWLAILCRYFHEVSNRLLGLSTFSFLGYLVSEFHLF